MVLIRKGKMMLGKQSLTPYPPPPRGGGGGGGGEGLVVEMEGVILGLIRGGNIVANEG